MYVDGRPSFGLPVISVYLGSPKGELQKKRNIELFIKVGIRTLARVLLLEIFHRASMFLLFRLYISDCLVSLGTYSTVDLVFI